VRSHVRSPAPCRTSRVTKQGQQAIYGTAHPGAYQATACDDIVDRAHPTAWALAMPSDCDKANGKTGGMALRNLGGGISSDDSQLQLRKVVKDRHLRLIPGAKALHGDGLLVKKLGLTCGEAMRSIRRPGGSMDSASCPLHGFEGHRRLVSTVTSWHKSASAGNWLYRIGYLLNRYNAERDNHCRNLNDTCSPGHGPIGRPTMHRQSRV
jgi:hypothetical protein